MELEHQDLSGIRGTANAGLATGIIGTALGVLNGGLGGLTGVNTQALSTDEINKRIVDTYVELQKQINDINVRLASMDSAIAVNAANQNNVASQFYGLTKLVIPSTSVCSGTTSV